MDGQRAERVRERIAARSPKDSSSIPRSSALFTRPRELPAAALPTVSRARWGTSGGPFRWPLAGSANHSAAPVASCQREWLPEPTVLRTPAERANRPSQCRQVHVLFRRPLGSVPKKVRTRTPLGVRTQRRCELSAPPVDRGEWSGPRSTARLGGCTCAPQWADDQDGVGGAVRLQGARLTAQGGRGSCADRDSPATGSSSAKNAVSRVGRIFGPHGYKA